MAPLKLDPEYAKALEPFLPLMAVQQPLAVHDVEGRRQRIKELSSSIMSSLPDAPGVSIDPIVIKSYDGTEIDILHVHLTDAGANNTTAAFVHAHGGGMIAGSAHSYIKTVAYTVAATKVPFFSVNYRKAPEHPHPTATEDVYAALQWVMSNATELNIDPSRIGLAGESSGAGVVAGVAIMARDREMTPAPVKQVLVYPMIDDRNLLPIPGLEELAGWKSQDNITSWTALLGEQAGKDGVSPYAAPARVASVEGLPPLYADVGELDIFKNETIDYVSRFAKANISVEFHLYPGLPHGFEAVGSGISATKRAIENRNRAYLSI